MYPRRFSDLRAAAPRAALLALALLAAGGVAGASGSVAGASGSADPPGSVAGRSAPPLAARRADAHRVLAGPYAVGTAVLPFVDHSRRVRFPGRPPQARPLVTDIWYPAAGHASRVAAGVPPARASGPFPLIVFGHGFDSTPAVYARLLEAWARAGYVVAAPIFPRSNEHARGGADEDDIVNQPRDLSFVITRMLAVSADEDGLFSGLIERHEVAVAGQSDGAATALASAYDSRYLDPRVDAAVILSGAEIMPGRYFAGRNPPLLATQGTADRINDPKYTYQFFHAAHAPKFLLRLIGARHIGPYTSQQPQLGVVERVTVAFLDRYLKRLPGAQSRLWRAGESPPIATLSNGR